MISFVQSWFTPSANPVGIDFGTRCLRLAQVDKTEGEFRLVAAASAEVPAILGDDPTSRLSFFTNTLRELWIKGSFRGNRATLALPAANMHIQHLRLPRMDHDSVKKALPWELQGKLPIDPSQAVLRHIVAGDVYSGQDPRSEVIAMAADRQFVEQLLAAVAKASIQVVAMLVEPKALVDCFRHIYRRQEDASAVNCFVDLGSSGTRAVIERGGQIRFARAIRVTGEELERSPGKFVEELSLCRRYYEAAFPAHPVQRLIFVGGAARKRDLCAGIARELGIAAQIGDPLVRMGRTTQVGIESGIDRRQPQPAWAVAIGLSMGSADAHSSVSNLQTTTSQVTP